MVKLTHVWLEAPFLSDALSALPEQVTVLPPAAPSESPHMAAAPAQAVLASSLLRYDGALMDLLPHLRIIARTGIGVDNVDLDAATARGIVVCNTPDGPTESTAEHTVAMLLALAKRLKQGGTQMAAGRFGPRSELLGTEVRDKVLGLIGLGRIGRRVAQICGTGLGMQVMAYDPFVTPEQATGWGVALAELHQVLAEADFLSLHAPSLPETYQLMDRARIALMKDGAYLLNLARGSLVDTDALLEALDSGKLAGAGLDVFDPEPLPANSPLRHHPNLVVTPHSASVTVEGRTRMERMAVERIMAFFSGKRPADVVNSAVLEAAKDEAG
jgi:D-3-phosphoglycerate dehydrogenase / 2-oxoglutarate reductase